VTLAARLRRLFSFFGRARRREYWLTMLPVNVAIWGVLFLIASSALDDTSLEGLALGVLLVALVMNLGIAARRLHDRGRSGWWLTVYFGAPVVFMAAIMVLPTGGRYGTWTALLLIPLFGSLIWTLVELGFRKGSHGPNRFGPDPTGRVNLTVFD